MERFLIEGGTALNGKVKVHGAKNVALPILSAALLIDGESVIHNCPDLSDVRASVHILESLGCQCHREGDTLTVKSDAICSSQIPDDLMQKTRSSIIFLGAVAARCGTAVLSSPGGCDLGPRPIDLHLSSLRQLGLCIKEEHGSLYCNSEKGLFGTSIYIPIPSVGTTENIMIAAATAKGTTRICNAAREPEIVDLANFLNGAGANVQGAGSCDIVIEGVSSLHSVEHSIIPDRILTATYMSTVAVTGGDALIEGAIPEHLKAVSAEFIKMGCQISTKNEGIRIAAPKRLSRLKSVKTQYYPGFPTDAGPTLIAALCTADGTSTFTENIFENRFKFVDELRRLGADIKTEGRTAIIDGVKALSGAQVKCTDLRGGAALLVAGLAANGVTTLCDVHHINRGYENPVENFKNLGANIKRTDV